ncbi:hypothetical protein [Streptomyces sp. NPDC047525]|uniref:hypothetical protein n=1 Tax=Streptomyces sp. NPDC047525 TaxID=3155264 RepID=UPI0033CD6BBC
MPQQPRRDLHAHLCTPHPHRAATLDDTAYADLLGSEFGRTTTGNGMKWDARRSVGRSSARVPQLGLEIATRLAVRQSAAPPPG